MSASKIAADAADPLNGGVEADEETPLLTSGSRSLPDDGGERNGVTASSSFASTTNTTTTTTATAATSPSIGSVGTAVTDAEADDEEDSPLVAGDGSRKSLASPSSSPYLSGVSRARFWVIFPGLMFTYFVVLFDSTLLASSHPVITSYFGASEAASWLSTSYLLTNTAFGPFAGRASDSLGRKPVYVAGLVVFNLATLWCALAGSIAQFIAARAVAGLAAGAMMTMASVCIGDLVPIEIRGTYQSVINVIYGLAAMSGASLGGVLADNLGWRWEFGAQIPLLFLCLVVIVIALPNNIGLYGKPRESLRTAMKAFDAKGSILVTLMTTFLILGLDLGGSVLPWSHPFIITSLASTALVFFPLLLYVEHRAERPVMPLDLISKRPFMNLIFANHVASFLTNAILFNVPIFFQAVLLASATSSGLRLAVPSAVASIAGIATGFLVSYTKRLKWAPMLGACLYFVGTCMLASMRRSWDSEPLYLVCLVPAALGQGFQFPGTFLALLAVKDHAEQAVVTTTLNLWRSLGSVAGIAVSSLVLQAGLGAFLDAFVQDGSQKAEVIRRVRASVGAVKQLEEPYQSQVVRSYQAALSVMFACCAVLALVSVLLIIPIRLGRMGSKPGQGAVDDAAEECESNGGASESRG